MSRNYRFHNPDGVYFVSFAVVEWLDVFTRNEYKDLLLASIRFSQFHKGMEVFAWVLMTNHIHLVFRTEPDRLPGQVLGSVKRHSSNQIITAISESRVESRKKNLLEVFKRNAQDKNNVNQYQFWRHDNHPVELWSPKVLAQKIYYVHQNPVEAGIVGCPEDYLYSSAKDYSGEKGLLDVTVVK
jgi:REP element-mobilizing transposase RayT